jgi:predicted dehydrogenase
MRPLAIAIVGAGPWGLTLTSTFARLAQVQVRWICDLDEDRRARASAAHPDARVTADLTDLLADPEVAAIVVAVDPARHHAVSLQALEAGKHLFVEKPLALSARHAREIQAAAIARRRVLSVGHVLLHNPAIRRARQIVDGGGLGEPLAFTSRRATPGTPRRSGSAWWALAPHDVSLALHLFDGLPTTVAATGKDWGQAQEDNAATAVLHFANGRTAHIEVARFASKRREVTIAGPGGRLTFDELAPSDQTLRLWTPQDGTVIAPSESVDPLRAQCLDFVARVAGEDTSAESGAHAVDVVRVLEAGERSMREQGRPHPVRSTPPDSAAVPVDGSGDRASFEAA